MSVFGHWKHGGMMKNSEAERLVYRIGLGDSDAERQFCSSYYESTRSFVRNLVREDTVAEDLTQDAMLTVLLALRDNKLRQAQSLNRYLKQTAHYIVISWYRKKGNQFHQSIDDVPVSDTGKSLEDFVYNCERRELIASLIDSMSVERDRDFLVRHYIHDEDKADICSETGLSGQHFDRVISRARSRCRSIMVQQDSLQGLALISNA